MSNETSQSKNLMSGQVVGIRESRNWFDKRYTVYQVLIKSTDGKYYLISSVSDSDGFRLEELEESEINEYIGVKIRGEE